jgi:hypothetical protein
MPKAYTAPSPMMKEEKSRSMMGEAKPAEAAAAPAPAAAAPAA